MRTPAGRPNLFGSAHSEMQPLDTPTIPNQVSSHSAHQSLLRFASSLNNQFIMVSVQHCNKHEYEASGELTECYLKSRCLRLKPSPSFIITGLDPEKKYQLYLSFKEIGILRQKGHKKLSNAPQEAFIEPNIEHQFGMASGEVFMDGMISFENFRITNDIQKVGDQIIHLNSCHIYTPVLRIQEFDSQIAPLKFSFNEASFRAVERFTVKRTKEKRTADKEGEENLVKRQCHGPVLEVPVLTETKDSQSQVEGHASPTVEEQDSSSMNDHSLISVKLANKSHYTKNDELIECFVTKQPLFLKPSPVFSVTGLDREKKYRVFLSFKQTENLRKHRSQPLTSKPPLPFNEPNVEHKLGIASGEKIMEGTICFEGIKITSNIETAGGRTMFVNSCHVYTPVLMIKEVNSEATPLKFSCDEASFRVVKRFTVKRTKDKKMTNNEDKENPKKRQCKDGKDEVLYQLSQEINTPIQDSLQEQSYQGQFQDRIRAPAQFGGQQVQLEEDAIHNQIQRQPHFPASQVPVYQEQALQGQALVGGQQVQLASDAKTDAIHNQLDPQRHDEAFPAGAPQDRFQAQGYIQNKVQHPGQLQDDRHCPQFPGHASQVQEHNNFQLQSARVHDQLQIQHHGQVPQGPAQLLFEAHNHPQQSRHLTHFQSQSVLVHDYLPTENQVPQGPSQLPFDVRVHSNHNQFAPQHQLGHPHASQIPMYPQLPVQASHPHVPNQSHFQIQQAPAQLPFDVRVHSNHNQFAPQHQFGHPHASQVPMYPQIPVPASRSHVPNQPNYHAPQLPVHPPAQNHPPFNPNLMIPPHPGFNNPIPQYPYPPIHRPTMLPTQQYPHQFNHPSPHNPNFMPHPQIFPQQFPPRNTHPQYPYNGPHYSYQ